MPPYKLIINLYSDIEYVRKTEYNICVDIRVYKCEQERRLVCIFKESVTESKRTVVARIFTLRGRRGVSHC